MLTTILSKGIFSFLFWTWLFGALGALISVPLTVLLMFVLDTSDETRWLATLMSANNGKKPVEPIAIQPEKSEEATGQQSETR